jgi:hypothetical protein
LGRKVALRKTILRANRHFLAGCIWHITTAAAKKISLKFFPRSPRRYLHWVSKPGSEKLSQDSFGSDFRFPFNLTYFNYSRKNFQHDCPKSTRSFVALLGEAFGVWRANAAAMSPKLFGEKLKEV